MVRTTTTTTTVIILKKWLKWFLIQQVYDHKLLHKVWWSSLYGECSFPDYLITDTKVSSDVQSQAIWIEQILNYQAEQFIQEC